MTQYFFGFDPDLHHSATAWVPEDLKHIYVNIFVVPAKLKGLEAATAMCAVVQSCFGRLYVPTAAAAVVEGQDFHRQGGTAPTQTIANLGPVTGAAVGALSRLTPNVRIKLAREWKGNVPKHIHHARIGVALGWVIETRGSIDNKTAYGVPVRMMTGAPPIPHLALESDWKHGMDAIGLALYARDQFLKGGPR